ncbi:MAG: flagellar hook-basal body complex protein, partial [Planctomycetota bacterium]|nr:flagellar hook-basal body complex protein [Planctomycetota bacterium]
ITIPSDAINLTVDEFGNVQYQEGAGIVNAGQITLARFINPAGLQAIGGNIYVPTYASGEAEVAEANVDGYGAIKQFFLESSNAEPVTELVSLIKTQRAFEMNSQVIQAANETLQEIVNLRRF